jgi:hypothetical protein
MIIIMAVLDRVAVPQASRKDDWRKIVFLMVEESLWREHRLSLPGGHDRWIEWNEREEDLIAQAYDSDHQVRPNEVQRKEFLGV